MDNKLKIDANYHSHTFRCGHAVGTDEEYVQKAIEAGFKVIGFSDHVILPNASQPGMRGDYSLLDGYISSVNELKRKYASKIDVFLAFECEWFWEEYASYYKSLLTQRGFDYLILGQHLCRIDGRFVYYSQIADRELGVKMYTDDVVSALESGLFSYVAHPDHFMLWYRDWDEVTEKAAWRICRKAKETNTPLEINMGPSRWASKSDPEDPSIYVYPYPEFFKIAKIVGNDVVIGVDAHVPNEYLTSDYSWAINFAKKLGFEPLKRVDFKKIL